MVRTIVYISIALLAFACGKVESESQVSTIAALRNIETNNHSVLISQNISIEGLIVGNSEYGEFYNCLIVEDQSSAVKIMCEIEDHTQYPFGAKVLINCSGLYLTNYYGNLTLGAEPSGEYTLDYISQSKLGRYIKECSLDYSEYSAMKITIADLTPLHIYRYVKLDNVMISNSNSVTTFCQRDDSTGRTVDTEHILTDSNGDTTTLFVDRLCTYADQPLPTSAGSICAIVDYFNGEYSLTITNASFNISDL